MTQKLLKSKYHYNPSTGIFTRISTNKKTTYITSTGYKRIKINGTAYREHRLAWLYVYGYIPEGIIDHINRNKIDNAISNLRIATYSENKVNTDILRNNTSGEKCIHYHEAKRKYQVSVTRNHKRKHLGYFDTIKDAITARNCYLNDIL